MDYIVKDKYLKFTYLLTRKGQIKIITKRTVHYATVRKQIQPRNNSHLGTISIHFIEKGKYQMIVKPVWSPLVLKKKREIPDNSGMSGFFVLVLDSGHRGTGTTTTYKVAEQIMHFLRIQNLLLYV